jgi:hypothetical protein
MNYADLIAAVELEWEPDTGFFWRACQGQFDPEGFQRARSKLGAVTFDENAQLPRRLVSLLWYIPIFLSWRIDRVRESGGDCQAYSQATAAMTNEVERLLGVP